MNYYQHNDSKGRDSRVRVQINHADRARMYTAFAEHALGDITLFMSKRDITARAREARVYNLGVR